MRQQCCEKRILSHSSDLSNLGSVMETPGFVASLSDVQAGKDPMYGCHLKKGKSFRTMTLNLLIPTLAPSRQLA